jgi:diguanylate cyclase (GGDEF)-like protein
MSLKGKQHSWNIHQWLTDSRIFFDSTAAVNGARNWEILRPMSVLYLIYLCFYLFVMCPVMGIRRQTSAVQIFALIHAAFTLWVFLPRRKTPSVRTVDLAISLFAVQILGLAGYLEIAVFSGDASFMFPLCLVLMTQIYTRRLSYRIVEIFLPSAVYLFFCQRTESAAHFLMDIASVSIAVGISCVAIYTITTYKMRAYHTQMTLEKMCTLDPMTGVNNKPTFEFRVEAFLNSHPKGGYALALCDLDAFKAVNDKYGHRIGDDVLKAFTQRLHQLVDTNPDIISGRFGGDEFVLFFKHFDDPHEIRKKMEELCSISGFEFPVTCSIGIAVSPSGSSGFQKLFDIADKSLYRTKSHLHGSISMTDADTSAPLF